MDQDDRPAERGELSPEEDDTSLEDLQAAREALDVQQPARAALAPQPMFRTLFLEAVRTQAPEDTVLLDFAQYVVGPLSDQLGMSSAKGGAFFREKEALGYNVAHVQHDQTMRAHLVNGMLPAYHVANYLAAWDAHPMRNWTDEAKRLFIAGYMLHDYTKIQGIKDALEQVGFREMEAPSERQIPSLESIFIEWCDRLGLDAFLQPQPLGGAANVAHELMYIACNTQVLRGTVHAPGLFPKLHRELVDEYLLAEKVSRLADLLAYSREARNPRALVASPAIRRALSALAYAPNVPGQSVARLTYHHVAENRGVLLNFIHNAALEALHIDGQREPLLYAPSGVVYLERYDAPPMPDPAALTEHVVESIRTKAGERLIDTGKGAKRGNVSVQMDESYGDFFDLREFIANSVKLIERYVKNNKSKDRLGAVTGGNWPGADNIPPIPTDSKDARLDQLAEWIKLAETTLEERFPAFDFAGWAFSRLSIEDLRADFEALRAHTAAKSADGGLKRWWFWAASHALHHRPSTDPTNKDYPDNLLPWIEWLAADLATVLPADLPESAQANEDTWRDLADYVGRVLTVGGTKAPQAAQGQELARYTSAKGKRGGAVCAICGSKYDTRKPVETVVAFQPGVYTARIRIGGSDNKRNICSICALEQLLRQLFVDNLDSGSAVEGQRVRYLSFYPSYFFTPETLSFMRMVYGRIKDVRLSNKDLWHALKTHDLADPKFWQQLEEFLIPESDEEPSRRVLRYGEAAQTTFLTVGFRNFQDPTDTESWILPAFLSLVLPICLDVKVVASESGVPLLLEADELPETVWFDGAHAAIQALLVSNASEKEAKQEWKLTPNRDGRLRTNDILPSLARLTAAYLIHLDTEYAPPKEHWQRFSPIAHSLMESPLYVFHYLKKQERDDRQVGPNQVRRYVGYAESIFNPQGDVLMSHARELVTLYRQFYRVHKPFQASSYALLRPLDIVADTLLNADTRLYDSKEALAEVARGQLHDRLESSETSATVFRGREAEGAMQQFCEKFVNVFDSIFKRDVAALRGKQLNLLRSACEVLYLDMQRQEWAERGREAEEAGDANEAATA